MIRKTISKEVYEASDGKQFETENQAQTWERFLRAKEYVKNISKVARFYLASSQLDYQMICLYNTGGQFSGWHRGSFPDSVWIRVRLFVNDDDSWVDDNEFLFEDQLEEMLKEMR